MTKIRIGITDHSPPPFEVEREALGAEAEMVFLDSRQEQDYDPEILKSLDALLVWRAKITSKTVDQLERCRIVVRYGVGYDAVDLTSLKNNGIPFCNVPDYGTEEVADTALALILGLFRGTPAAPSAPRSVAACASSCATVRPRRANIDGSSPPGLTWCPGKSPEVRRLMKPFQRRCAAPFV